jgi:predicted alpha-1,2-mannosidase
VKTLASCCAILLLLPGALAAGQFTKHVNPFVGTAGHGHTYPGAAAPFGMVQLSPDTRVEGWDACSGYHYSDSTILGFSHTHLSGTGVADYGDILMMPTVGALNILPGDELIPRSGYRSRFRHASEKASPGYYSVMLDDYDILAELTATTRVGVHRYTYPATDSANIIIDMKHGLGPDVVLESSLEIIGDRQVAGMRRSAGWAKDQWCYFVAEFSKPFSGYGISENYSLYPERRSASGKNIKAYVRFSTKRGEAVTVKVGISAVDLAGARRNLREEARGWDFDAVRARTEKQWDRELGAIEVEGGTAEQFRTFYTALYHAMLTPNVFSDADGRYRGMDGTIRTAKGFTMYTVFSLWDTFRAEHPLLTIIDQKRTRDFVRSLVAKSQESGVLPVWELGANETWCMIGYHAVPVIVDAFMKGIKDFDVPAAYAAMRHSAMLDHYGLKEYRAHGYVPGEMESESVSKTLEYSYDDWCIARMAAAIGNTADAELFTRRAQFYKNVFDPRTGFMRAKENGAWVEPFDPAAVTVHYTEANAWQYSFFAPQDISGLMGRMGGMDAFAKRLDELFSAPTGLRGRDQADITGMVGQYAQGNEPSHHVAYLYNYAGYPWKTQALVRHIMDTLFTAQPDGICGNDDCGQMSAWYVMSALGIYQVTPGLPVYAIGSPLFQSATIHLENGKTFSIDAPRNARGRPFIQSAALRGRRYSKSYLPHSELMRGGSLVLAMGADPNTSWGVYAADRPQTPPLAPIVTVPFVSAGAVSFADSTQVELSTDNDGADVFYYVVGSGQSGVQSLKYTSPITLKANTTLNMFSMRDGAPPSELATATFVRKQRLGSIALRAPYSPQYTGGGDGALLDGIRGREDFRLGGWQGYEGNDLEAVIDLDSARAISSVSLGCLQDNNSWIFFPTQVEFSFSSDGAAWRDAVVVANDVSPKETAVAIKDFTAKVSALRARYVRVRAANLGVCPGWHRGAGGKAWLFADEITVQ